MRKVVVFMVVFLVGVALAPLHLSNSYLRSNDFDVVTIKSGQTVWSIAEQYTYDEKTAASLTEAIIDINGLDAAASVRVGQNLKVPVLHRSQVQMAEK